MPKKKKELTLDPTLVDEYVTRRLAVQQEADTVSEMVKDLRVEFVGRGLDVTVVNKAITAARAIVTAKAPEASVNEVVEAVMLKWSVAP